MAERPTLPLETQAAIEQEIENVRDLAHTGYLLVFQGDLARSLQNSPSQVRRPAGLKLELQKYSSSLFDAEARHYSKHASSEDEMRQWLQGLAFRIENEVMEEIEKHSSAHDLHCTAVERRKAIIDGLEGRINHWIEVAKTDSTAIMARSRASSVRFEATKARAEEVLAELNAPTEAEYQDTDPLKPLLDSVSARWLADAREDIQNRDRAYEFFSHQQFAGGCMGRAMKRLEVFEHITSQMVTRRIDIYKSVSEEFHSKDMLSLERLKELRDDIKGFIHTAGQAVRERNERDCHAAGEAIPAALEASARTLPAIEARIFDTADTKIRVIEADVIARNTYSRGGSATAIQPNTERTPATEEPSMAEQLDALRVECRLTFEDLAGLVDLDATNVSRHLSGKSTPQLRNISAYERVFSKHLKRQIVIRKKPSKRS